jgi:predicted transcriptional regulator
MNEETRQLALEKKKALSMERRQKALSLLENGMSRREIAKTLGLSMGSVNVYCNGFKSSTGINKPVDISKSIDTNKSIDISNPINTNTSTNISTPSSINKHIDTNKPIGTKKQNKKLIGCNWHDLLKESITAFIQESVETVLKEVSVQDIIKTAIIKALKNDNKDFSTNINKAVKVKSKKKTVSVPVAVVEENPMVDNPIKENPEPIEAVPMVENNVEEKPIEGKSIGENIDPIADEPSQDTETTILMLLSKPPALNLETDSIFS